MSHTANRWVRISNVLARQAADALTNSVTTEQFFQSQFPIDPAFLTAGRTFRGKYRFLLTTNSLYAGTLTMKLYLLPASGTRTLIGTSSPVTVATLLSNVALVVENSFSITAGGSPASFEAQGEGRMFPSQGGAMTGFSLSNAAPITTADFTQGQSLQMSVQFSSAAGSASLALVLPVFEYTEL